MQFARLTNRDRPKTIPSMPLVTHLQLPYRTYFKSFLAISVIVLASSAILARLTLLSSHFPPTSSIVRSISTTRGMSYEKELQIALLAVQRASILTKSVFHTTSKGTQSKSDTSPVTVGDFGAQALIISALKHNFPSDSIVAEEEAAELRNNKQLSQQIWDYVQATKLDDSTSEDKLGGPVPNENAMLDAIDGGNSQGGNKGRIWAIDPIDGTKGFLRGGQYAVCLALIVDGQVRVGVLGCPNLPVDDSVPLDAHTGENATDAEGKGVLFSAVEGQGAQSRPLSKGGLMDGKSIKMTPLDDISSATFCESFEAGHSSHGDQAEIAKLLGIVKPSVRMDSQAKYGSIARGAGDLYLRLPVRKDYEEKIWDHAAGILIVREAGGEVTDIKGNGHDFGVGRTLKNNKGVVAAPKAVHSQILSAVQKVLGTKP